MQLMKFDEKDLPVDISTLHFEEELHRRTDTRVYPGNFDAQVRPWDIVCNNQLGKGIVVDTFRKYKTLGLGETYIDGLWCCNDLPGLFKRLFKTNENSPNGFIFDHPNSWRLIFDQLLSKYLNRSLRNQYRVAKEHYDIPSILYEGFLGATMKYTCGDWTGIKYSADNLDIAQENNLEYWVDLLKIKDGDVVLDCGCGWGALASFLLKKGLDVTYIGITISQSQLDYLHKKFADTNNCHFFFHSYHDNYNNILQELKLKCIDKCIFLETIEHAGVRNWPKVLENVRRAMSSTGLLGLQIIGADHQELILDPFINKYIFPFAQLGTVENLGKAISHKRQFRQVNCIDKVAFYPKTLRAWNDNFQRNRIELTPVVQSFLQMTPFDSAEKWMRQWEFYLQLCEGALSAKNYVQLFQVLLEPNC